MQPLPPPPDPFANTDPLWQPWSPQSNDDLAMPDNTPTSLKNFIRETVRIATKQLNTDPMPAKPVPFDGAPIEVPRRF
jgi:hypothetical protein